jgi:hypothetical protein
MRRITAWVAGKHRAEDVESATALEFPGRA